MNNSQPINMSILLISILLCFLAGNVYIYIRALQAMKKANKVTKIIFTLLYWLSAVSLFIILPLRHHNLPAYIPRIMFTVGSVWLVFTLYMSLIMFAMDVAKQLFFKQMKQTFLWALAATTLLLVYGYINYLNPKVQRLNIPIEKHFDGDTLTVVGISDLHLGYGTGKARLKDFVKMINAEKPDAIFIAGDLIDNSLIPLYEEKMYEELNMLQAPLGIYMCTGNHEYLDKMEDVREFISMTPIRLLEDSIATLPNGIQILGKNFNYRNNRNRTLTQLGKQLDFDRPVIILDHEPRSIAIKDKMGFDLQFSGHTHNGQIWPGNYVTSYIYDQDHGYRKWSHSHVFVSSGLSLWGPPLRIGTDCDMAVFRIYSTKKRL